MIDFLCIGAQKAGTTLLYEHLKKIDDIFLPESKELHFFDDIKNYHRGINYYFEYFKNAKTDQKKGEITPAYIFFDKVPGRIRQSLNSEKIKFIVLLRNPVDRAYSQYNMSIKQGHENLSFEQALMYENYRLKEYSDCVNFTYLKRGFYSKQILNYFKYFNKKKFKFILFEKFVKEQKKYIYEILDFLEIDIKEIKSLKIENQIVFQNKYETMNLKTREILNKIYEKEINILENITELDLSAWKEG